MIESSLVTPGSLLSGKYYILQELGRGGFGRTYLAEDYHKFKEKCVLKEFAPQVQGVEAINKAGELFQREAEVLYKLNNNQIPKFRELFKVSGSQGESLFLAQDFVDGESYLSILNEYLKQGRKFSEAEVIKLFQELLPVLSYIHSLNVIHRDISPDNIIRRKSDSLPVLIDFGAVKEIAGLAQQMYGQSTLGTKIGKFGFVPNEQMIHGKVYPNSDLYALAATGLTLLTGYEPKDLYNSKDSRWDWSQYVSLSPEFNSILYKMLAHKPNDRYQSATEVLVAINNFKKSPSSTPETTQNPSKIHQLKTLVASPDASSTNNNPSSATTILTPPEIDWIKPAKIVGGIVGLLLVSLLLLSAIFKGVGNLFKSSPQSSPVTSVTPTTSNQPTPNSRRDRIIKEINSLPNKTAIYQEIDRIFHSKHPELNKRSLTDKPEDQKLRDEWLDIAEQQLKKQ